MPINIKLTALIIIVTTLYASHLSSIFCDYLHYDDLARYSEAIGAVDPVEYELVLAVRLKRTLVMPLINWPMTKLMSINVPAARALLVLFMALVSATLFLICYRKFKLSIYSSLILSIPPLIVPGITNVPLMIVGSYGLYGLLAFILSIYFAKLFIDTEKYKYLLYQLIAFLLAIEITESAIPILIIAIVTLYYLRTGVWKKYYLLASSVYIISAVIKIIRVLLQPIGSTTVTSLPLETIVERFIRFVAWGMPYWAIEKSPYLGLILSGLTAISIVFVIYLLWSIKEPGRIYNKGCHQFSLNELFLILTVCALIWSILSFLPFVASGYYSNRYGVIGAIGISWFYLLPIAYLIEKGIKFNWVKGVLVFCILMTSAIQSNAAFKVEFSQGEVITRAIRKSLNKYQFPSDSQIVIIGLSNNITAGYWVWSTGFLQRVTGRKDITGIAGHEHKNYDPFADDTRGYSYRMQGLDRTKPTFVFRFNNGTLLPMKYGLQWISEIKWNLLSFDSSSGEIQELASGFSIDELRKAVTGVSETVAWY